MSRTAELYDSFTDDCSEGTVIGTPSASGHTRLGVDVEGVLSIDNRALRIAPLIQSGFGRAVLAYGPFRTRPGLAFVVHFLNGHNTAQGEPLPDTFRERIARWLKGSETDPQWQRLGRWLRSGRVRRTLRQFRWWKRTAKEVPSVPLLDENFAVGWFPQIVIPDPRVEGNAFIMHALGPENGELWAGGPESRTRSLRGVQNVPLSLMAIVRDGGVVYYVSSINGTPGMAPHPRFSPVAVDYSPPGDELYLGIQQSVLGQIGFRLDTRINGVRIAHVPGYRLWCGGAHAAERIINQGTLEGAVAELGGRWRVIVEPASRDAGNQASTCTGTVAVLDPGSPSGLLHAIVALGINGLTRVGLVWRCLDERNHWRVELSACTSEIVLVEEGERNVVASRGHRDFIGNQAHRIQVLDNGSQLMAYVDGEPLLEGWLLDPRLEKGTKVGIFLDEPDQGHESIRSFEAHPRQIRVSESLDMKMPNVPCGKSRRRGR